MIAPVIVSSFNPFSQECAKLMLFVRSLATNKVVLSSNAVLVLFVRISATQCVKTLSIFSVFIP